ncbi:hypothetical protein [Methylobacterium iners]|uniref:Uncharacterized protein n=1 Tax=Methylobacterium iners TaxID=418707 RepID=A0ABQ4S3X2_9HYPH|nr:hypothetical protein [Methylobacterium iners]GJD97751.1 hypothetical protein OCOJLMKI_4984 [Methylobacterium iners]
MSRIIRFEVPPGKPVLRGHDYFWRVIRELDEQGTWTVADIRPLTGGGIDRSTIRDFVKRLAVGGYADVVDVLDGRPRYRLLQRPLAAPRLRRDGTAALQGRGQAAMWNVIRGPMGRDGFTFKDLALYASGAQIEITHETARTYVRRLADAGMLHCLRQGGPARPAVWRLKPVFTGPLPPMILRGHIVFDQNNNRAVGPVEAEEIGL